MKAIEFKTIIKDGIIRIPKYCKNFKDTQARVIVVADENTESGNYDKTLLSKMLTLTQSANIFNEIDNSVDWQKQQRHDWEFINQ